MTTKKTTRAARKPNLDAATKEAKPAKTGVAALDDIFQSVNRSTSPGLVVGVAQNGIALYRRGFGLASIEHAVANTPATRMRIASISKQFTCFGALLLAEDGKLDLDAPANGILPELPKLQGCPTLRQFMTHASGLHDAGDLSFMSRGLIPVADGLALRSVRQQTGVNFAPGQGQLYSNTGYALLSIAIERASGMSFERFMKTRVFEPLGMGGSESVPSDMMIIPGLATMHQAMPDGSWRRGMSPGEDHQGAGAMVSTVDDLLTWLGHLRGQRRSIGTVKTWQQMIEPATLDNGFQTQYALGIIRNRYRGLEVLHHGGSLIGVASQLITVPSHALDIAIIANCELINPVELGYQVIDAIIGAETLAPTPPIATSDRFKHLFGTRYHGESGMLIGFDDVGGKLGFSFLHSPPIPLLEDRGDELSLGGGGTGPFVLKVADLAADANGRPPQTLTMMDAGHAVRLKRLASKPPATLTVGEPLIGRYRVADLDATARVEVEGDKLALHIDTPQGTRSATLEALGPDVFGVLVRDPVFPARYVITVDGKAARPSFSLDGGRSRHIHFARIEH